VAASSGAVELFLPRFESASDIDLRTVIEGELGVTDLFVVPLTLASGWETSLHRFWGPELEGSDKPVEGFIFAWPTVVVDHRDRQGLCFTVQSIKQESCAPSHL
jgi:hypothetical protein